MKVGIIGLGFVGGAILKYLTSVGKDRIQSYDIKDGPMEDGYDRVVAHSEIIYVCVPTPMGQSGVCDLSYVECALEMINERAKGLNRMPIVMVKSTMVPGSSERLQIKFPHMILVTNPEFLTERRAYEDLVETKAHVVGCRGGLKGPVGLLLTNFLVGRWPESKVLAMEPTEAEMVKYMTNTYFALKVSFANQMYQLCRAMGLDYSRFIKGAVEADPRLEPTHWDVPGPDGRLGFGGKCFPKDLNGMMTLCSDNFVDHSILQAAWDYNLRVREDKDWLQIEGAVSEHREVKLTEFTHGDWLNFLANLPQGS
jgi:UDPglucose 6-dehydrogenase